MFHVLCQRDNRIFLKFFPAGGGGREALVKKITLVKAGAVCYHYHDILPMMWGRKQKDKENFIMKVLVINAGSSSLKYQLMDPETGKVRFKTNHAGGILGGITTWEDIRFRCAVKPTPTVSVPQHTVNVKEMKDVILSPITRRDPTLLPRIYPVIEAMTRCALLDAIYMAEAYWKVSGIDEKWLKI